MFPFHTKSTIQLLIATIALALPAAIGSPVWAEGSTSFGNGAFGVNRVVRTNNSGFVQIEGTATVNASLPDPTTNTDARAHMNKPNPYLGGRVGGSEYEGGLIWEPNNATVGGLTYFPGWTAFLRGGGYATSPQILSQNGNTAPWRYSTGQSSTSASISSKVTFTFHGSRKVSLQVGAMPHGGRFFLGPYAAANNQTRITPSEGQGVVTLPVNQLGTANVKRVAALTRAGSPGQPGFIGQSGFHDELDGSIVTITWRGVQVREQGTNLRDLVSADINQAATGYDGAPDGHPLYKNYDLIVKNFQSPPKRSRNAAGVVISRKTVEFPNLVQGSNYGRSPGSGNATEPLQTGIPSVSVSRYTKETVRINLRAASRANGVGGFNGF